MDKPVYNDFILNKKFNGLSDLEKFLAYMCDHMQNTVMHSNEIQNRLHELNEKLNDTQGSGTNFWEELCGNVSSLASQNSYQNYAYARSSPMTDADLVTGTAKQVRFTEVKNQFPSGFKIDIIKLDIVTNKATGAHSLECYYRY
jgi:hypothetical protein